MIKYQIKNKEVIITDTYLSYGKDSIKFEDIIDFEFSHQYVNFVEIGRASCRERVLVVV